MAAFVFPLIVKLLLERTGLYALSAEDLGNLDAIDRLLIAQRWTEGSWREIVYRRQLRAAIRKSLTDTNPLP